MCTGAEAAPAAEAAKGAAEIGSALGAGEAAGGAFAGEALAGGAGIETLGSSIAGDLVFGDAAAAAAAGGAGAAAGAVGEGLGGEAGAGLSTALDTELGTAFTEAGAGEGAAGAGLSSALDTELGGAFLGAGTSGAPSAGGFGGVPDVGVDFGGDTVLGLPGEGGLGTLPDKGMMVKDALEKLVKYGPLALGAAGMMNQRAAANRFRSQMQSLSGPQRRMGEQLLAQYESGKLNAGDAARIDQWEQSAIAQSRQFFSRAGTADSTQAQTSEQNIKQQAEAMRQQALKGLLTTGLNTLNVTDQYQAAGLEAEMQADQQATQAAMNFLGSYGQWLRGVPVITGKDKAAA